MGSHSHAARWIAVATVALGGIALTGCAASTPTGDADGEIHLAVSAPLTGDSAAYGIETLNGIRLAVDEINADGGIHGRQVKLSEFDDRCDPAVAATAASTIISDPSIVAVIGNVCSSATQAQLPIFERSSLPVFAATTSSPQLSKSGYEGFARVIPNDDVQGRMTVELGASVLGYTRIAVLYPSDDYGQSLYAVAQQAAAETGAEIVAAETYVTGSTSDFSSVLANIAAADPQALYLAGYYGDMGAAVSQSPRVFGDRDIALLANAQTQVAEYVELAGAAGEGTWVTNIYDVTDTSDANQSFVSAYTEAYDVEPGLQAAAGYDNVYVLAKAIEDAGGSTDDLAAAIRATEYDGAIGHIAFDENGDNVGGAAVVLQLRDGAWQFAADETQKLSAQ